MRKKERGKEERGLFFLKAETRTAGPMSASAHLLACKVRNGR